MANIPLTTCSYGRLENEPEDRGYSAVPEQATTQPQPSSVAQPQPCCAVQPLAPGAVQPMFVQQPVMSSYPVPAYPTMPPYTGQPGGIQFVQPAVQQPYVHAVPHVNLLPNDYLVITLVFFVLCIIFNFTSIALGLPALLLSILAYNYKARGKYDHAKLLGNIAIYLTLANVIYTLVSDMLIVGLTIGLHCRQPPGYYYGPRC